jgi:hypothetical protein
MPKADTFIPSVAILLPKGNRDENSSQIASQLALEYLKCKA